VLQRSEDDGTCTDLRSMSGLDVYALKGTATLRLGTSFTGVVSYKENMFHGCIVTTAVCRISSCVSLKLLQLCGLFYCTTLCFVRHEQEQQRKVQFQISTNFAGSTKMVQRGRRSRTITVDIGRLVTSSKSTNITCDGATSLTPFNMHSVACRISD